LSSKCGIAPVLAVESGLTMSLLVEQKGRVQHVTLNRPQKRNALDVETCKGILAAVKSAQENGSIGSILIDAMGPVFCVGVDLEEVSSVPQDELTRIHDELFSMGCWSVKPIVISVNGSALSGGFGLAAQGHVVLVAEGSVFGLTEIRVGLWPFAVYRCVAAVIGSRRTLELSLMGRVINAEDALRWGLAQQVSPPFELADRAMAVARDLAKASPDAIAAGMRFRRDSQDQSPEEAHASANALRLKLMAGNDFKEGWTAFKEKREPRWPSMPDGYYRRRHSFPRQGYAGDGEEAHTSIGDFER
jgi:enoyl-CoA hydratase/carnithine racemase